MDGVVEVGYICGAKKEEMNIALLIAGGRGNRMGQDIPKQFMVVDGAPIIVHTMGAFERHPDVDGIGVVCLEGWETILTSYAKQFNISKFRWLFKGGRSGMESIHNGIYGLRAEGVGDDAIVMIHDAVRPLVSEDIISGNIATCQAYGNAITGIRCREAVLETMDGERSERSISRDSLVRTQTPQTFRLGDIIEAHEEAWRRGIEDSVASCTLMAELGGRVMHLTAGSEKNIKVTTVEDLEIMKALMHVTRESWLK